MFVSHYTQLCYFTSYYFLVSFPSLTFTPNPYSYLHINVGRLPTNEKVSSPTSSISSHSVYILPVKSCGFKHLNPICISSPHISPKIFPLLYLGGLIGILELTYPAGHGGSRGQEIETIMVNLVKPRLY